MRSANPSAPADPSLSTHVAAHVPQPCDGLTARCIPPTSPACRVASPSPALPHASPRQALRPWLLPLAALILLATVLASKSVYAFAPAATAAPRTTQAAAPSADAPSPDARAARPNAARTEPASTKPTTESREPTGPQPTAKPSAQRDASAAKAEPPARAARAKRQSPPPKAGAKGTKAATGGKKSISIDDDFLIEGKLEKPNAYFILRRSSVDFDWARLGATFSPLVLESVQDPLF